MIMSNMSNSGDGSMDLSEMVAAATQLGGRGGGHHQLLHHHHQPLRGLKKGPWTTAEDSILMEYVKKHGEGNWNAVQKNSGLARCGKSCRLRWANHLRPNLKKGSLTPEEERIIIELHAKYGNKWARMASQLPGRTDNEIKNYWNTRMKRRQRAGLPIYPHELQQHEASASFQQAQHQQQRHNSNSTSSFSSLLSSSHPRKANYSSTPSSLSLYDHISFDAPLQNHHNSPSLSYSNPAVKTAQFNSNSSFAISISPLSPVSPFGTSSSSALFNQNTLPNQTLLSTPSQYYNNSGHGGFGNYDTLTLSSMIMGAPSYEPMNSELPLSQRTPPYSPYTPTKPAPNSVNFNGGEGLMEAASGNTNGYDVETVTSPGKRSGGGLLDDVLVQAGTLSRNKRSRSGDSSSGESGKDKYVAEEDDESAGQEEEEDNVQDESTWKSSGENSAENLRDASSSPSVGMKPSEDPLEDMDDDLLSLLNFQSTAPVSESWYGGSISNQASPGMIGASDMNASLDVQQNTSSYASAVNMSSAAEPDDEIKRSLPPCFWNNMPGIC